MSNLQRFTTNNITQGLHVKCSENNLGENNLQGWDQITVYQKGSGLIPLESNI